MINAMKVKSARQLAYTVLLRVEKEKAYSNLALDSELKNSNLEKRDKAFAAALVYGVIERRITIDYNLSLYLSKPLKKLKPEPLTALRLGAFQLIFSSRVPDSAAVNESVKLSKSNGFSYSSGLINAILRKVAKNGFIFPDSGDKINFLSVKYSCPGHLIEKWLSEYGEKNTLSILKHSLCNSKITVRVNTLRTTAADLKESFEKTGVKCDYGPAENSLVLSLSGTAVDETVQFKKGLFHVQGIPSQLCAIALDAKAGETVYDLCSAPGGKAFTIAEIMNNNGKVFAFDLYEGRVRLIEKGAKRLGINIISAAISDASVFEPMLKQADRVLCDVPCSGLGIIAKKPEIKYKDKSEFAALPDIQYSILENGSKYVKHSGRLVYSTCTLNKSENEGVCERFLRNHKDFVSVNPFGITENEHFVTFFPDEDNNDGFFVAAFERKDHA